MSSSHTNTLFARALQEVERFSERDVAVLPLTASTEMLRYIAHVTGEDIDKLARLYQLFITTGRLDSFTADSHPVAGFAEK